MYENCSQLITTAPDSEPKVMSKKVICHGRACSNKETESCDDYGRQRGHIGQTIVRPNGGSSVFFPDLLSFVLKEEKCSAI